jgi:hypothetical protein
MTAYVIAYYDDGQYLCGPFPTRDDAEAALTTLRPVGSHAEVVQVEPFADVLADYGRPAEPVWSGT